MDLLALNRIIQDNSPSPSSNGTSSTFTPAHIGASSSTSVSRDVAESKTTKTETNEIWNPEELPDKIDLIGKEDTTRKRPHFDILYKQNVTSEDMYLGMTGKNQSSHSCNFLTVRVDLPGAKTKELNVDITGTKLVVQSEKYKLVLSLPHRVRDKDGKAKWDSDKSRLSITLPIVREDTF